MMKMKARHPKKWPQPAVKKMEEKGTVGSETRIAHEHGQSPLGFARSHTHDPNPSIRRKALFAANMNKGK
jgi:hypothetical protein